MYACMIELLNNNNTKKKDTCLHSFVLSETYCNID